MSTTLEPTTAANQCNQYPTGRRSHPPQLRRLPDQIQMVWHLENFVARTEDPRLPNRSELRAIRFRPAKS